MDVKNLADVTLLLFSVFALVYNQLTINKVIIFSTVLTVFITLVIIIFFLFFFLFV